MSKYIVLKDKIYIMTFDTILGYYIAEKKMMKISCKTCVHGKNRKACAVTGQPTHEGLIPNCIFYS